MCKFNEDLDYITDGEIDLVILAKLDENNKLFKNPVYAYNIYIHNTTTIIGRVDLRIGGMDDEEIYYAGNIGIDINELYQEKDYAYMALQLIESIAKKIGMKEILIACLREDSKTKRLANYTFYETEDIKEIPNGTIAYLNGYRERILYKKTLKTNIRKKSDNNGK